jgi:hypothetical protein
MALTLPASGSHQGRRAQVSGFMSRAVGWCFVGWCFVGWRFVGWRFVGCAG